MASTIKLKNGSGAPLASDLVAGEPALDLTNKRLYTEDSGGTVIEVGTNPAAEITANAGIALPDNQKATFGAGDDLQIYHDGSNSYIADEGTGELFISGASSVGILNGDRSEYMINAVQNGAVTAYHNGSAKLATTSTGIDVTGTVTADGLTVDGAVDTSAIQINTAYGSSGEKYSAIRWNNTSFSGGDSEIRNVVNGAGSVGASLEFYTDQTSTGTLTERMKLHNNGDISFYEDTGTTAKFFWDASEEQLQLGSPVSSTGGGALAVSSNANNHAIYIEETGAFGENWAIGVDVDGDLGFYNSGSTTATVTFQDDGNVGIGTDSPARQVTISSSGNPTLSLQSESTSGLSLIFFGDPDDDNEGRIVYDNANDSMDFFTSATERMSIDSSGNVGIGTEPHSNSKLHILDSTSSLDDYTIHIEAYTPAVVWQDISGASTDFAIQVDGSAMMFRYGDTSTETQLASEAMRITSGGNVGIGTTSPQLAPLHVTTSSTYTINLQNDASNESGVIFSRNGNPSASSTAIVGNGETDGYIDFITGGSDSMRIDSSGNLLVGTTRDTIGDDSGTNTNGSNIFADGTAVFGKNGNRPLIVNRGTNDGDLVQLKKDGSAVGSIGSRSSTYLYIGSPSTNGAIGFVSGSVRPVTATGSDNNDALDLGASGVAWDDVYATNGTIQTSDRNEKQDIEALSEAEQRVAVACKGLLRKFRWKSKVAEKGDDARIHFGIIAQDLQAAFEAEGLDAGRYAMFIHSTWTDEETGEERSRMGVRYSELLAFIIAAI